MRKLIFLVVILVLAKFAAAQNYPPGTQCGQLYQNTAGCKHPLSNRPPTVSLKAKIADARTLELCKGGLIPSAECARAGEHIKLTVNAADPDGDKMDFIYGTTGGRIIGQGSEVFWNLQGTGPGWYTTTVVVEDGCGCSASETVVWEWSGPAWLTGTWEGTGYQWDTGSSWLVIMKATPDGYTIEYPGLKCGGKWQMLETEAETATFTERLSYGTDVCEASGRVRIKKLPSGELGFSYARSTSPDIVAAGILKKKQITAKPSKQSR